LCLLLCDSQTFGACRAGVIHRTFDTESGSYPGTFYPTTNSLLKQCGLQEFEINGNGFIGFIGE